MKDIKSIIIGFLLATCMFLFSGWTGYNQGEIGCKSITLLDNEGKVYGNIDKSLIDKINIYDTIIGNMNQILDFTIKDISEIDSELKEIKSEFDKNNANFTSLIIESQDHLEDDISTTKANLNKDILGINSELKEIKSEFDKNNANFTSLIIESQDHLEDDISSINANLNKDLESIHWYISQIYDLIEVSKPKKINDNLKFEYIPREVEPSAYPGFSVEDFVKYPEAAKEAGIEGRVIIAAFINVKGVPENVYLVKGVFESLDQVALNAVKQSRWIPAKQQNKRIGVWVNIPISFKLR